MTFAELWKLCERRWDGTPSERTNAYSGKSLIRWLADTRLEQIDSAKVLWFRRQRSGEGAAPATINREVAVLRVCIRHAYEPLGLIERLPLRWGAQPTQPRDRVLSLDEAKAVLESLRRSHPWSYHMVRVLLGTGARTSEIVMAKRSAVTKVGESYRIAVSSPKERSPKVVMATGGAAQSVAALLEAEGQAPFSRGQSAYNAHQSLRRRLRRACDDCVIERCTLHDLRRTFACWALRQGATLEAIGQTLGHRSYETTRRYARLDEAAKTLVAERVTSLMM